MRSTLIVGRIAPMPKDPHLTENKPHGARMFASGILRRRTTVPSERYWQAHYVTDSGHVIYAYLDMDACERLTRNRAGLR